VLGQYDLLMAGQAAEATSTGPESGADGSNGDTVYLVGPNMVELETRFGFPPSQFRLWVMLHELTHRAQFTGVPWMREHYLSLVRDALSLSELDPAHVMRVLRDSVQDRAGTKATAEGALTAGRLRRRARSASGTARRGARQPAARFREARRARSAVRPRRPAQRRWWSRRPSPR